MGARGQVTYYGDPNEGTPQSFRAPKRISKTDDGQEGAYRGMSVGRIIALRYFDKKERREITRIGFIFNEEFGKPQVTLLAREVQLEALRADLSAVVAEKVRQFPQFVAKRQEEIALETQDEKIPTAALDTIETQEL